MATLKDFRDERLRKLDELKKLGVNPYPAASARTHHLQEIVDKFDSLEDTEVTVVGRVVSIRKFGKLAFIVLRDMSGSLQLFIRTGDSAAEADRAKSELVMPDEIALLDSGDFVECSGKVIKTQTGEISVACQKLRLLTKALRPMPSMQEGFTDKEQRLRRRYVDMNVNFDVRDRFVRRSRFWQATREFLNSNEFLEVNIPVLEHTTGGADANPFVTHMDALDQDFYLRISHELPLKRLIGAGFEKVYDIGPRFRNENYSDEHLPEHVAMEWYWAYADWQDGMKFMEAMLREVLQSAFGKLQFDFNGQTIDMSKDWERWDYATVIKENYGIDVFNCTIDQVKEQLKKHGLEVEKTENIARGIDKLWKKIRANVVGPIWLINTPMFISPLSKASDDNPNYVQRFQAVIAGSELCNGWSELNDPIDQLNRFVEQQQMRDVGDDEAQMLDIDYVEMLEYGMPPACGLGYSERVFWIFEGVTAREGVPFPQLRHEIDEVTKSLYPQVNFAQKNNSTTTKKVEKELPISAVEQGTKKLYLDDYSLLACDANVVSIEDLGEQNYRIELDQSCIYPGGGGQPCDLGTISWEGGKLILVDVFKDKDGVMYHEGSLEGALPENDQAVRCSVDAERRLLNSRLHCAGHLLDYGVMQLGLDWKSGKSSHFPGRCSVDYAGAYDTEKAAELAISIEQKVNEYIQNGGAVGVTRVPSNEAKNYSQYIPEFVINSYQNVHIATYPDNFNICCGGTHVADVAEIGTVKITKIKKKDGAIRVSYDLV